MHEIYTRQVKTPTGNGTTNLKIFPTRDKLVYSLQVQIVCAGVANTLLALMAGITEIRYKVGTRKRSVINATKLRDFMLLHGTTYDFNGSPATGAQITIPFAPEWFIENVQDALAWNPRRLGGEISVEIDCTNNMTVVVLERIADIDPNQASAGIITFDMLKPVAGSTAFFVEKEIEPRGRLMQISTYPDSTNAREITPLSLSLGDDENYAHEAVTSAQNDEQLERFSLTPAATGRTADIYDLVFVKQDSLARAIDLGIRGKAQMKVEAAATMAGTCDILVVRLETNQV